MRHAVGHLRNRGLALGWHVWAGLAAARRRRFRTRRAALEHWRESKVLGALAQWLLVRNRRRDKRAAAARHLLASTRGLRARLAAVGGGVDGARRAVGALAPVRGAAAARALARLGDAGGQHRRAARRASRMGKCAAAMRARGEARGLRRWSEAAAEARAALDEKRRRLAEREPPAWPEAWPGRPSPSRRRLAQRAAHMLDAVGAAVEASAGSHELRGRWRGCGAEGAARGGRGGGAARGRGGGGRGGAARREARLARMPHYRRPTVAWRSTRSRSRPSSSRRGTRRMTSRASQLRMQRQNQQLLLRKHGLPSEVMGMPPDEYVNPPPPESVKRRCRRDDGGIKRGPRHRPQHRRRHRRRRRRAIGGGGGGGGAGAGAARAAEVAQAAAVALAAVAAAWLPSRRTPSRVAA